MDHTRRLNSSRLLNSLRLSRRRLPTRRTNRERVISHTRNARSRIREPLSMTGISLATPSNPRWLRRCPRQSPDSPRPAHPRLLLGRSSRICSLDSQSHSSLLRTVKKQGIFPRVNPSRVLTRRVCLTKVLCRPLNPSLPRARLCLRTTRWQTPPSRREPSEMLRWTRTRRASNSGIKKSSQSARSRSKAVPTITTSILM